MIGGLVLAGGQSSRMKEDKALLSFRQKTLIHHAFQKLKQLPLSSIFVSGNYPSYPCLLDVWPRSGPAAGILSAAKQLSNQEITHLLIIPLDMPLLSEKVFSLLMENIKYPIESVFIEDFPLPCCVSISSINKISAYYQAQPNISIKRLLTEYLQYKILSKKDINEAEFLNVNTPEEFHYLRAHYETENSA